MIETKNIKLLSDKVLIEQTDFLVQTERKTTLQILQHLREIEIRLDGREISSRGCGYP